MRRFALVLGASALAAMLLTPAPTVAGSWTVVAAVAGGEHACVLTAAGSVRCWGANYEGQVGDGTRRARKIPVDVAALDHGVVALAAHGNHTCAVTESGGVRCWGANGEGQVGDGTTSTRTAPVDVVGLGTGVSAIGLGPFHSCAVTDTGGVRCWGRNGAGQLGDGTTRQRETPVDVVGLSEPVRAVTAGINHTCVLTDAGGVQCWGRNSSGQLGDGTTRERLRPTDVIGLADGVVAIGAGWNSSYALTEDGSLLSWGANDYGQLGDGTRTDRREPVRVVELPPATALAAGWEHACALTDGTVRCWGANYSGSLGDGTDQHRLTPVTTLGLWEGVTAIAAGGRSCAITRLGALRCWGGDSLLGDGTRYGRPVPVSVRGFDGIHGRIHPDLSIRRTGGAWLGEGIVERTGSLQRLELTLEGSKAVVRVRLEHGGCGLDQFFLEGHASGRPPHIRFYRGDEDLTREVLGGSAWVELMPEGRSRLRIVVRFGSDVKPGTELEVMLRARSSHDPSIVDAVSVVATAA